MQRIKLRRAKYIALTIRLLPDKRPASARRVNHVGDAGRTFFKGLAMNDTFEASAGADANGAADTLGTPAAPQPDNGAIARLFRPDRWTMQPSQYLKDIQAEIARGEYVVLSAEDWEARCAAIERAERERDEAAAQDLAARFNATKLYFEICRRSTGSYATTLAADELPVFERAWEIATTRRDALPMLAE